MRLVIGLSLSRGLGHEKTPRHERGSRAISG
jgi:hypothetical protein